MFLWSWDIFRCRCSSPLRKIKFFPFEKNTAFNSPSGVCVDSTAVFHSFSSSSTVNGSVGWDSAPTPSARSSRSSRCHKKLEIWMIFIKQVERMLLSLSCAAATHTTTNRPFLEGIYRHLSFLWRQRISEATTTVPCYRHSTKCLQGILSRGVVNCRPFATHQSFLLPT